MAIDSPYATTAEYRAVTGATDTGNDAQILIDLTAVSRFLERRLERFFNRDAADVERIYLPSRTTDTLTVDDLPAAPTSIKIDDDDDGDFDDETALESSDYELLPLNADKGPEPRPFTQIRLTPWGSRSCFYVGRRVQVTARWGWLAVPGPIKAATIQLTAIYRLETPRATRRIPELGEAIEASSQAQSIIERMASMYWRPR